MKNDMKIKTVMTMMAAAVLTTAAALMVACSPEDNETQASKDAVSISTRVTQSGNQASAAATQTRTDAADAPYTSTGATLTLCYGSTAGSQKSAFTYTDGNGWTTTQPLYWQDLKPNADAPEAEKYAFYAVAPQMPADVNKGEVGKDQGNTRAAGSTQAAGNTQAAGDLTPFEASDLLMAYQTAAKSGQLDLNLKHILSQLQVQLVSGDGADALTADELASATLSINGLQTQYTLAYSGTAMGVGADGTGAGGTGADAGAGGTVPSTAFPALATATGAPASGLTPYTDGNDATKSFRFIAPPQALNASALVLKFTLNVGGTQRSYTYTSGSDIGLSAGAITRMEITATRTALTLGNITVTDWTIPATITGTVTIDITGNTGGAGSTPAFGSMKIWKGKEAFTGASGGNPTGAEALTEAPAGALEYKKGAGNTWSTTGTPFYIDDVQSADRFYALALNAATSGGNAILDTKTGLNDPLAAGPAQMSRGAVALTYRHLLAKLRITLKAGSGFDDNLLNGAAISTPAMFHAYTLSYNAGADGAIIATGTGNKSAYNGLSAGTDYIVVPQTTSGAFTVELENGNSYTASPSLTLKSGEITTLELTLNPSGIGVTVSVTDWTDASASQTIRIDGINNPGTPGISGGGSFSPSNGDALKLTYVTSNGALSGDATQTATYSYSSSGASGNWTSSAPLAWDAIPASSFSGNFAALYTSSTTTPEKDFLTGLATTGSGSSTNSGYGTALSLTLSHAMSQISVTLKPGEGYKNTSGDASTGGGTPNDGTDAMLAALTTRIIRLQGTTTGYTPTVKADGTADITLAPAVSDLIGGANATPDVADAPFGNGTLYTVPPQTLTADHAIVLKLANGNSYTLKLADIEKAADAGSGTVTKAGGSSAVTRAGSGTAEKLFGAEGKMEPGRKYAITITVDETAVSLSGSIEAWTELSGSGSMKPDWEQQ